MLKLQMPGKMKKAQANDQQSYVDLLNMEGDIIASDENINFDTNINNITISSGDNLDYYSFFGKWDNNSQSVWISQKDEVYTFTGKLQADGEAQVSPCIIYYDENKVVENPVNNTESTVENTKPIEDRKSTRLNSSHT